ncbi:hypothetical protein QLX67_00070 [Balneolaceae bacterium ANBcel3]|nr:hypothetical protein [Balneolaceae bacterium ANBcel3]
MKLSVALLLVFLGSLLPEVLSAQVSQPRERTTVVAGSDSVYVLDPWIIHESFEVYADSVQLSDSDGDLQPIEGIWIWNKPPSVREKYDSLYFRYHVWLHDLPFIWRERERITTGLESDTIRVADPERERVQSRDLFEGTSLNRSGSIRRGVVIGSGRDMSMDSGLRFDVSGFITDDLEVVASLTDKSTPIQPEGTTQTLREFDQVHIQLMHRLGMLQMGDVDLRLDESRFAVIDRRVQGVDLQLNPGPFGGHQASASVARGNYHRMSFSGMDGVQGPYRLSGANNEPFMIVLAGSEKVYVNGNRVQRGEENDYIIDYGIGEITFTSNMMITAHSRIVVEFQYLTEAYTRTLLAAESQVDDLLNGRLSFGASVIREADNVQWSTQYFLSDREREILEAAGNDPSRAVVSGADSVGYRTDAGHLLYSIADTLYQGETYQIYRHIPGDTTAVYRVYFSRVDEGEGDYRRVGRSANGMLYEWVGPGNGNYAPQRRLEMPVEQRMIALRSAFAVTPGVRLFSEWAASYQDQNRFSEIDNEHNAGMALLAGITMDPKRTPAGVVGWSVTGRYEGKNFAYFDRVREVEFERRWNIRPRPSDEEKRIESSLNWSPVNSFNLNIGAGYMEKHLYTGNRMEAEIEYNDISMPHVRYYLERVETRDRLYNEQSNWWRHQGSAEYPVSIAEGSLTPLFQFEAEDRQEFDASGDTLRAVSNRFYDLGPGVMYQINQNLGVGATLSYREDEAVLDGSFQKESTGITQRYRINYERSDIIRTENVIGFRKRTYEEAFRLEHQAMDSRAVLVRSVSDLRLWDQFFETRLLYDVNTERRPLLQEAYIEVGPEMGQYVWIDLNNDGVQQIDEFFPEQTPNEGTFIKQLVPSDELYPVVSLKARWSKIFDFSRLVDPYEARYSSWLNFLSGVRWRSVVDVQEENRTGQMEDIYLLKWNRFQDDSLTVRGRLYVEQDLELFRHHTRRDLRLTTEYLRAQNQQASGLEKQGALIFSLRTGTRLSSRYRMSLEASAGQKKNDSEMFQSRNYDITTYSIRPRFNIRWNHLLQSGMEVGFRYGKDAFPVSNASVQGYSVMKDARLNLASRWQSLLRLEWRSYHLSNGPVSSLSEFELTGGAGLGNTWTWSVQSDYRISDFLRANIQYDGRTVTGRPLVQTMRFTVSAVF